MLIIVFVFIVPKYHKTNPKYRDSLMFVINQCVQILQYFGIEIEYLKELKKNEDKTENCFQISDKHQNLIRYFDIIGYRYCLIKKMNSAKVVEYLKYKNRLVEKYVELIKDIRVPRLKENEEI